jgi:hypothetical protein
MSPWYTSSSVILIRSMKEEGAGNDDIEGRDKEPSVKVE